MLKIGDLAKLCKISIRALRHYNRIKLFQPEYIDAASGYRYYSEDQIKNLVFILDLKDIGFPLHEIASVLENNAEPSNLIDLLYKKRCEAQDKIQLEKLKIENIDSIITKIREESGIRRHPAKHQEYPRFNDKLARLLTLDSSTSETRHAIEETIWL